MTKTRYSLHSALCLLLGATLLLSSCSGKQEPAADVSHQHVSTITGMWANVHNESIDGRHDEYYDLYATNGRTILKSYEPDGLCYKFIRHHRDSHDTYVPHTKESYQLRLAPGDTLYSEGNIPIRLCSLSDSVMIIEWEGTLQTWHKLTDFPESQRLELESMARDAMGGDRSLRQEYFLERFIDTRHQLSWLIRLLLALGGVLLVGGGVLLHFFRRKRQLERALRELQDEISDRPSVITQATEAARDELYESEWYQTLRQRLTQGECLTDDDWTEVAHQVRRIYPNFRSRLYELCRLSDTEFRVCLLLKLHIAPADIATALCRDKSTISSIRSRLYAKVFSRKGSSKDWDDFIETL
ncbi:MAG: hypothetical protein MJZ40_00345 [Bacteroidaceae bacterium]|nr:hypothetical protein [Bacteroidaceae bacterium]